MSNPPYTDLELILATLAKELEPLKARGLIIRAPCRGCLVLVTPEYATEKEKQPHLEIPGQDRSQGREDHGTDQIQRPGANEAEPAEGSGDQAKAEGRA